MKRIILALLVIFSLVIALPSCELSSGTASNPEFDWLNTLCARSFSNYTIDISVESEDGVKVTEHYDVKIVDGVKNINYRIERLSAFDIVDGEIVLPNDYMSVVEGSITTTEEDEYALPTFNFSYDCLKSDVVISNTLKAKITSLSKFMGVDFEATDAKVIAVYSSYTVESVSITYTSESGNVVTITYTY